MSTSIFNIPDWSAGNTYAVNDIVKYSGSFNSLTLTNQYLYCTESHIAGFTFDSSKWGGYILYEGETKPQFLWRPSYDVELENEPRVKTIQFGDSYQQRVADIINNKLLTLPLTFTQRALQEITAIEHFLYTRGGVESFVFTPVQPYNIQKKFVVKKWSDTYRFKNNYNLTATFEEVVN